MTKKMSLLAAIALTATAFTGCASSPQQQQATAVAGNLVQAVTNPGDNTEIQLMAKQKALQEECNQISKAVPCAVGIGEVDQLPAAINRSERDARYKLAQSIKTFVELASSDTSFIDGRTAHEFSETGGKVRIDEIALEKSIALKSEYGIMTDINNGQKYYRAITLMAIDPQLYSEAQEIIQPLPAVQAPAQATPQASQQVVAKQEGTASTESNESKFKKIAAKTATFLLGVAKKAIGL